MGSIRIIATPPSELATLAIRQAWVGVEIPLLTEEWLKEYPLAPSRAGTANFGGYIVLRSEAVRALRLQGKEEAADYWDAFPAGMYLQFKREVCEEI